jgi:hypothetical protein
LKSPYPRKDGHCEGKPRDFQTLCLIMLKGQENSIYKPIKIFKGEGRGQNIGNRKVE